MYDFKLDDNQKKALAFHLKNRWSFNCMNMGEGKTLTALEAMRQAKCDNIVIYCPAYLKENWRSEIQKFYGTDYPHFKLLSYASKEKVDNYDGLILDEFHYLKSHTAQRTNRIYNHLYKVKPKMMVGLSGTPMKNTAFDFYTYFMMLSIKHKGVRMPRDPYAFQATFCRKIDNDFTPSGHSYEGINPERLDELKSKIRPHFYFTPKQLRPILPDVIEKKYMANVRGNKVTLMQRAHDEGRSQEFMALKSLNALSNTATTIKLINDLLYEGKRPVVFTEHRDSALAIAEKYKLKAIMGGVSAQARNYILKDFDNSISSVLIGTYGAMGSGLNIVSTDTMVFNDYCFSPSDYEQARKRIHRKGQNKTCYYHHVFANQLDYQIFKRLMTKRKESHEINKMETKS